MIEDLPYVDTHTISIALGPDQVWHAVRRYAGSLGLSPRSPFGRVLAAQPPSGFAVVSEEVGERIVLAGRHRFATYRLEFELDARTADRTTLVHARTWAAFPGAQGRAYRLLVVSSGLHVIATKAMLQQIRRSSGSGT